MQEETASYLRKLKKKYNFEIVDAHIHPLDVMGVSHISDVKIGSRKKQENPHKPGFLERLNFGRVSNTVSRTVFGRFEKLVAKEIKSMFEGVTTDDVISEMDYSAVDKVVFLPVEPWSRTADVCEHFDNKRFYNLGSIDAHGVNKKEIESTIDNYIKNYNIVGIKLHPNLQGFKPQPSHNDKELGEKLEEIYSIADKRGLYLLFHGGMSVFTDLMHEKYKEHPRGKDNAIIENFVCPDGKSELLDRINVPVVIAHMGHFGLSNLDEEAILKVAQNKNVFFDTAATSPKMIARMIDLVGPERIIYGSDGIYNKMLHSAEIVIRAVNRSGVENKEKAIVDILGKNYTERVIGG